MVYEREVYAVASQLQLRALSAVNHELLVADAHHLRTGIVPCGGQCRTAPQYMYLELFHYGTNLCIVAVCCKSCCVKKGAGRKKGDDFNSGQVSSPANREGDPKKNGSPSLVY